ncbi:PAS domain-containing protein [Pseudomonas sp. Ap32]|nr:PAS domain-containing protein [Pseudomonas sp. Ap32]
MFELEHRVLLPDGTFGWTLSRAIPILDEAGEITEWFGAASDLTERHLTQARLSESEAAFKIMADTMPQLAWVCDTHGKIVFVNDQWKQYFGEAGKQKNAKLLAAACIHPDDIQHTLDDFHRACSTGEPFESEHRLCAEDGKYRWFMVRAMPYRDPESGKILRWYGMSLDVHDRHDAEDQLRDFNEQLELEVQAPLP